MPAHLTVCQLVPGGGFKISASVATLLLTASRRHTFLFPGTAAFDVAVELPVEQMEKWTLQVMVDGYRNPSRARKTADFISENVWPHVPSLTSLIEREPGGSADLQSTANVSAQVGLQVARPFSCRSGFDCRVAPRDVSFMREHPFMGAFAGDAPDGEEGNRDGGATVSSAVGKMLEVLQSLVAAASVGASKSDSTVIVADLSPGIGELTVPLAFLLDGTGGVVSLQGHRRRRQLLTANLVLAGRTNGAVHAVSAGPVAASTRTFDAPLSDVHSLPTQYRNFSLNVSEEYLTCALSGEWPCEVLLARKERQETLLLERLKDAEYPPALSALHALIERAEAELEAGGAHLKERMTGVGTSVETSVLRLDFRDSPLGVSKDRGEGGKESFPEAVLPLDFVVLSGEEPPDLILYKVELLPLPPDNLNKERGITEVADLSGLYGAASVLASRRPRLLLPLSIPLKNQVSSSSTAAERVRSDRNIQPDSWGGHDLERLRVDVERHLELLVQRERKRKRADSQEVGEGDESSAYAYRCAVADLGGSSRGGGGRACENTLSDDGGGNGGACRQKAEDQIGVFSVPERGKESSDEFAEDARILSSFEFVKNPGGLSWKEVPFSEQLQSFVRAFSVLLICSVEKLDSNNRVEF
uniref:Uncharacterized protein n=1 Tax=Chromera velia CCMP2878 TaxID=1169474 RepID=A0A0G4FHU7_9ALVE|eukprot:Cvel_17088.t1-p1 / transcript=Cvel_17088.t1 / gene=Cvel_17088 / organism=Chromera_velia_CCMP2878 / gene_product=hypothetical protein / transcript_product=hypothetical protein / location=Cvel_scaffold1347:31439-38512(-) / protein_length=643 / sequence_SO=supercontig / SO=protein_coding / is_pseudo=false